MTRALLWPLINGSKKTPIDFKRASPSLDPPVASMLHAQCFRTGFDSLDMILIC